MAVQTVDDGDDNDDDDDDRNKCFRAKPFRPLPQPPQKVTVEQRGVTENHFVDFVKPPSLTSSR